MSEHALYGLPVYESALMPEDKVAVMDRGGKLMVIVGMMEVEPLTLYGWDALRYALSPWRWGE